VVKCDAYGHGVVQCARALEGNISMDLSTIDVTGIAGAALGDEVLLIGASGQCSVTAADQARWAGTIPYEITCGLSPRVPRIYLQ
jgi:alanine racemase